MYDFVVQWLSRIRSRPRKIRDAAESMEHDCTHDGGVTEPQRRTLDRVPATRLRGSGVQLNLLWERCVRGSIPICTSRVAVTPTFPSPIARLTSTGCCVGCSQRHASRSHFATTMSRRLSLSVTSASELALLLPGVLDALDEQFRRTCLF